MGQGTMTLEDAAVASHLPVERLVEDAHAGRLTLARLPKCEKCGEEGPCAPGCAAAPLQVVWLGNWFYWFQTVRANA